jgi:DNA-binding GntR family transcriptional regulator
VSATTPSGRRPGKREIAASLRTRIDEGEFAAGDQLPSYRSIKEAYGVTLTTAQEAVRLLVAEGRVLVADRRRAVVLDPPTAGPGIDVLQMRSELVQVRSELREAGRRLLDAEERISRLTGSLVDQRGNGNA